MLILKKYFSHHSEFGNISRNLEARKQTKDILEISTGWAFRNNP
jgi:hypothetical protein